MEPANSSHQPGHDALPPSAMPLLVFEEAAAGSSFSVVSVTVPSATITAADQVGTAISSSGASSAATHIVFTMTLSEASADFVEADVTATNCANAAFAVVTSTVYTLTCDGRTGSTVSVSVGAGVFTNSAGTANAASSTSSAHSITHDFICCADRLPSSERMVRFCFHRCV